MSSLSKSVDACLNRMSQESKKQDWKAKGTAGEEAVFKICEKYYQDNGGILYHSYSYEVDDRCAGNIKRNDGKLFIENLGSTTEIDILLVTPRRIFPIEVKAYHANKIEIYPDKLVAGQVRDKNPVHQNEMHCRHLYEQIYTVLPKGKSEYIVPIVVFVDKCKEFIDHRPVSQKEYIKACILNSFRAYIQKYDTYGENSLNLRAVDSALIRCRSSYEKYLPCRDLSEK